VSTGRQIATDQSNKTECLIVAVCTDKV